MDKELRKFFVEVVKAYDYAVQLGYRGDRYTVISIPANVVSIMRKMTTDDAATDL